MCFVLNGCPLDQPGPATLSHGPGPLGSLRNGISPLLTRKHSLKKNGRGHPSPPALLLRRNRSLTAPASPSHPMRPLRPPPSVAGFPPAPCSRAHWLPVPLHSGFGPDPEFPSSCATRFRAFRGHPCSPSERSVHSRGPGPCVHRRS